MAETSALVGEVEPLDNPFEWAAQEAAKCKRWGELLEERVGALQEADVSTPEYAALVDQKKEVVKLAVAMCKVDLEERRVLIPVLQKERLASVTRASMSDTITDLKQALPPEHHHLLSEIPTLFAQHLRHHLEGTPDTAGVGDSTSETKGLAPAALTTSS